MKSSTACFPDAVVAGVPKNQKSSKPAQNSKGAQMKQQKSPELRYVNTKDSGKKHQHISSFSAVDTTPNPEIAVSENTRIHKPGARALGVVNQKPRAESSYEAGVLENYYKPGPRLDTSDAALCYSKELWEKYDASFRAQMGAHDASFREHNALFRAQMGEYHSSFRELMGSVFSRNHVKNAKTLNKYAEKYFSFPEGGSEAAQLVTIRGTRPLKCNQKGGRHLRGRWATAKKLRARVIAKILKKAKKVMRKKNQKEMPPSGDSQTGASENGEVETGSLGGSPAAPLEPDIEEEPPNPAVYMERVRSWQRELPRFRGSVYCEEFRFVNLERISSAEQAIEAVHRGIQMVLNDINIRLGLDDYIQLRLDGRNLNNPLFSVRRHRDDLSAEDFLNQASKLLQSNRELHVDGTLSLVVTVVKNMGGGSRRVLNSILSSQIIHTKRQCLVDLAYTGTNLCFAGGLLAVMSDRKPTDAELLEGARKLHEKLGWSDQKKVMLSDVEAFEQHLHVNIQVVHYTTKVKWGFFKTGGLMYPKTFFILLHNEHYYGVLDVKRLFGAKNYCEVCHTVFSHDHSCRYRCRFCTQCVPLCKFYTVDERRSVFHVFTGRLYQIHVLPHTAPGLEVQLQRLGGYLFTIHVQGHKINIVMFKVKGVFSVTTAEGVIIHKTQNKRFR